MKRELSLWLMLAMLLGGSVSPVRAADPDAVSPLTSYVYLDTLAGPPSQPNVISSLVSYLYHDSLATPPGQPNVVSPLVSYLYYDWLGDENLTFQNSPLVSYLYQVGNGSPFIIIQPYSQSVQAGSTATFGVLADGQPTLNYQWRLNGQNISGATSSTLTLNSVTAANFGGYSVVVSNPYGSVTSATASLKLLGVDTNIACYQMTTTDLPPKQPGKNNLVIVTHGWQFWEDIPIPFVAPDISWITNLCDVISNKIAGLGSSDWQVEPYAWLDKAGGGLNLNQFVRADNALHNAEDIGTKIGREIAEQGWAHVHLIGHSAGAGLIQKAAEAIYKNAPGIEVHTTFLDPFLGLDKHGLSEYGTNADWSDSYFDHDTVTGSYTEGRLPNAYNADVTWTESAPDITSIYASGYANQLYPQVLGCFAQTPLLDSHSYPHEFYQETVLGTQKSCAVSLGFSLSKEGGGWNNHASYVAGQLSSPCEECPGSPSIFNQSPLNLNPQVNLGLSPYATSPTDVTTLDLSGFSLTSGSPPPHTHLKSSTGTLSWIAVGLTITNAVNFIQFDVAFTDTNAAEGLLTVYWETNQIDR